LGPLGGKVQRDPAVGIERLRECQWEPAAEFPIPADWPSGVYVGKLTAERGGFQSYVIFIVRDDRACDFLFQCADATWSAYNRWPDHWSLYDDGTNEWYIGPKTRVSWDRPYGKYCEVVDNPLVTGSGSFMLWEFPLAFWMEKAGYDVSYISNVDTHADGAGLLRAKAFLSVGHDEYWSRETYDHVKSAIGEGASVGFLSSDTCWGIIPFWPSGTGAPHRVISRLGQFGPIEPEAVQRYPELRRFEQTGPSEADIIGARNVYPYSGGADWICSAEDHWLFAGTGMKNGDGTRPRRMGVDGSAREDPGPGGGRPRPCDVRERRTRIHGHSLSRPERQCRLQRRHDLVGRRPERSPGIRDALGPRGHPERSGSANPTDHREPVRAHVCEMNRPHSNPIAHSRWSVSEPRCGLPCAYTVRELKNRARCGLFGGLLSPS
jgi:hypothetical protein